MKPTLPSNLLLLSLFFTFFLPAARAADSTWELSAAEWSRPRSGIAVQQMAPVAQAVRAWQAARSQGEARLVIVHAGGEEGSVWAAELRDWLVALAVPREAVELAPAGLPADRLEIRLKSWPSGSPSAGEL